MLFTQGGISVADDVLRTAADLLRSKDFDEAKRILVPYVHANPEADDAWFLLSFIPDDRELKIDAILRALKINPESKHARARLSKLSHVPALDPEAPFKPTPSPHYEQMLPLIEQEEAPRSQADPEPQSPRHSEVVDQPFKTTPPRTGNSFAPFLMVGVVLLCLIFIGGGIIGYPALRKAQISAEKTQAAKRVEAIALTMGEGTATLPSVWTPTPTATITRIPSPTSPSTGTPTPDLIGPSSSELEEMKAIQIEVADMRGLSIVRDVDSFVIGRGGARPILETMFYASGGTEEEVEDEKRALIALGMVKPTYNLFDNILNNIADGIGGFYDAEIQRIYVLGLSFGGIEHYIYSHEYDHALVDQHYALGDLGVYPICTRNSDQCRAIQALVEGDATLLMDQWWNQYASPQDYQDILRYNPPWYTLPEQFPPPFAGRDGYFPYYEGLLFVEYIYERGNWAEVNKAYENLPLSSEQILHPDKYIQGEQPIEVAPFALESALGEGWREISRDSLGEWGTYLLLGYGADYEAQVDEFTALKASEGWGGDTYQVLYHDGDDSTALAAHWIWDTPTDASIFYDAISEYLKRRLRGSDIDRRDGDCWEANNQATCIFKQSRGVLWLFAPNQAILNTMLAEFPNFP